METLKYVFVVFMSFSAGLVISGAIFAFIAIIGVVPRLAQKTKTQKYLKFYEEAIIWGGIFGATTQFIDYYLPIGKIPLMIFSLCVGVFYGSLVICLTEILDVVPILTRRARLQDGITLFIFSIAIGKLAGSLLYYIYPCFYLLY